MASYLGHSTLMEGNEINNCVDSCTYLQQKILHLHYHYDLWYQSHHHWHPHHNPVLYNHKRKQEFSTFLKTFRQNFCQKLARPVSIYSKLFIKTGLLGCGWLLWIDILLADSNWPQPNSPVFRNTFEYILDRVCQALLWRVLHKSTPMKMG